MNIFNLFKTKPKSEPINVTMDSVDNYIIAQEITPEAIITAKNLKNSGELKNILALYDKLIKENDNLAGSIDIRKEAAKTATYTLPELPKKQTEYFTSILDKLLPELIDKAIDFKLKGLLFTQIIYRMENNIFYPEELKTYKNIDLRIEDDNLVLYVDDKKQKLPELNFYMMIKDDSILESLLKYYVFFSFALNNWAQFTETYGKPIRIGKYLPGTGKNDINILKNMVQSLGTDLSAVIPDSTLIEFVESQSKTATSNLYKDLANFVENRETRRILGQTMTTKESSSSGYAQARVHEMVRQDILLADLRDASLFVSDFCTRLNKINFSDDDIKVTLFSPKSVDNSSRITIDEKLNRIIDIPAKYFYDTYNIPEPESGVKKIETQNLAGPTLPVNNTAKGYYNFSNKAIYLSDKKAISKVTKVASKLKKQIQQMDYDDFKKLNYLAELQQTFGSELSKLVVTAYDKERSTMSNASKFYNSDNIDFAWDIADTEAVNAFRAEAFEVAHVTCDDMLKTLQEEAALAIKNGETFKDWAKNMELKGFEAKNPYHLRTNFETATSNARLASKWKNIEKQRDLFPFLKYVALMDERTREEHALLHGAVAPINDSFWDEFYPPNGWNCHCDVEQLTEDEAAKHSIYPQPYIELDEMWKKNTGKELSIYGSWLDRKVKDAGSYNYKDLGLPAWKDIKRTDTAPALLNLENVKDYRDYFESNIAGTIWDATDTPININLAFFDKQLAKGTQATARMQKMDWITPTIQKADEIWLQQDTKNRKYFVYFKAFKDTEKGGFSVVEIKQGEIRTFYEPDKQSYFDKNRKGELIYRK